MSKLMLATISLLLLIFSAATTSGSVGSWEFLQKSIGMPAMHMQLLSNDRVVIFDRTDFGHSNLSLPQGKCRHDPTERMVQTDCTAHSVEYDAPSNSFRPLTVQTDVWCSSGAAMPDGRLVQTGGYSDGERRAREIRPCSNDTCDWIEFDNSLSARRWYSTNQLLPDGRQIIVGGRRQFNYEFYPKNDAAPGVYSLPFLVQTNDPLVENNLYPFVFLNVDGNLFIFANNRAILYNLTSHSVVKSYPVIPGGDPRSYPSTGSAVLLPLKLTMKPAADVVDAEVLVCGGAPKGSYTTATKGNFVTALDTCARIKITDPNPAWIIEKMPKERVMGDMVSLPNGNVLIINGASSGTAGWELGRDPVLNPVLYLPENPVGSRFEVQNPTTIPRMYHSSAVLLRDGRVLVGGSNPHVYYNFTGVMFPTDLSLEAFSPGYLAGSFDGKRPEILSPSSGVGVSYGKKFGVQFKVAAGTAENGVIVTMVAPPFTTHSFSMNQRVLVLGREKLRSMGPASYQVTVSCPTSPNLAPPGYYMLFVVNQEIPSPGIWVKLG